ncbi:MAG: hypothetical protein CMJ64_11620 [Planctomycetaceae bacterium]|nr:hypothetical protein [Planctomycetaceae bacterium]
MTNEQPPTTKFRVKLGLTEVSVDCISKEEAIQLARKKLCDAWPSLGDVIRTADESRFQVEEIQDGSSS